MAEKVKSIFETLYAIDATDKVKKKQGLSYISWASALAEVKKVYPEMTFRVIPQIMDEFGNERFWHEDGKTGWVEVEVSGKNDSSDYESPQSVNPCRRDHIF